MDRFVANTLRTLGLIAVAICVIAVSLGVALLGLCFSILAQADNHNHPSPQSQSYLYLGIAAGIGVLIGGIVIIAILARIIFRESNGQDKKQGKLTAPYPLIPPATPPIVPKLTAPAPPVPQPRTVPDVATHLSPASAAVIQQLSAAIVAKIAAEVLLGLVGYYGAFGTPRAPFPLYQTGFMLWGIAAIAPHLILLYYLFRKPGRTTFAYALVIPLLHLLLGLIGHSAFLAFILRPGQFLAPLISIIPWILDLVILYLAWKAIRQTGIHPDPPRLIVAAVVILLYTTLLPALAVILNYLYTHPL
jgi:heme/copper-type cytochrome/quinol oxidase subunit 2